MQFLRGVYTLPGVEYPMLFEQVYYSNTGIPSADINWGINLSYSRWFMADSLKTQDDHFPHTANNTASTDSSFIMPGSHSTPHRGIDNVFHDMSILG